jgi:hypothetical protein
VEINIQPERTQNATLKQQGWGMIASSDKGSRSITAQRKELQDIMNAALPQLIRF